MLNPNKLRKDDLVKRINFRCVHSHNGLSHPNCFDQYYDVKKEVGYLDIESSGLFANFGIMLSYAIKREGSKEILGRHLEPKEMEEHLDKKLLEECIEDMKKFDTLLTYNGTNFDMPFLRTRALKHNIDFPKYMDLRHKDVYFMAKSRMRLHRKSMHVVSNALGIPGKTHVEGDYWIGATHQHRRDCLEMIFEHNKLDVIVLEKVYKKLKDYVMETRRSI